MKCIYATDLHGNIGIYNSLLKYDNLIIGGDITPHGTPEEQKDFLAKWLIPKLEHKKVFIQMANDDYRVNFNLLEKAGHILHNNVHKIDNTYLVGYSFVPQLPFLLKDWEKMDDETSIPLTPPERDVRTVPKEEGTIKEDLQKLKKLSDPKKTIYVIHAPPYNTKLDMVYDGTHVGSKSLRKFIEDEQPLLTLHGHIHESFEVTGAWKDKIGKTICVNPGNNHFVSIDTETLQIKLIEQ